MSKTLAASFNDNSIKDADVVKIWEAFDSRKQRLNYMNAFQHSPSELQMLFRVSSQNACDLSHAHLMVDHLVNSVSGFQSLDISSIEDKYNQPHPLRTYLYCVHYDSIKLDDTGNEELKSDVLPATGSRANESMPPLEHGFVGLGSGHNLDALMANSDNDMDVNGADNDSIFGDADNDIDPAIQPPDPSTQAPISAVDPSTQESLSESSDNDLQTAGLDVDEDEDDDETETIETTNSTGIAPRKRPIMEITNDDNAISATADSPPHKKRRIADLSQASSSSEDEFVMDMVSASEASHDEEQDQQDKAVNDGNEAMFYPPLIGYHADIDKLLCLLPRQGRLVMESLQLVDQSLKSVDQLARCGCGKLETNLLKASKRKGKRMGVGYELGLIREGMNTLCRLFEKQNEKEVMKQLKMVDLDVVGPMSKKVIDVIGSKGDVQQKDHSRTFVLNRGLMDLIESGVKKCESRAVNKLKWTTIFPGMRLIFKQKKGGRFSAIDTDKGSIIKICKNIKVIIDSELYPQDFKDLFPQFKGLCIQFNW
eukprot:83661_1